MNNSFDYVIDLRSSACDVDTAAILAADYKILFIINNVNYFPAKPSEELYDKIFWLYGSNEDIYDLISLSALKFDFVACYIAEIVSEKIVPIKRCIYNDSLNALRKGGICTPFYARLLSKQLASETKLFINTLIEGYANSIFNAFDNISYKEISAFSGSTGYSDRDIHDARNDSYKQSLIMRELVQLESYYKTTSLNPMLSINVLSLVRNRKNKINLLLKSFYNRQGDFTEFSGYPVVFKYLAAYLLLCAKYKINFGMYNSAFLYIFRSLDWFCDGILIMNGYAKIASKGNKIDELFLVENGKLNKPLGFGVKWSKLLTCPEFVQLDNAIRVTLGEYIEIRNHHAMTHGSLRISYSYLEKFKKDIMEFYTKIDIITNANGFTMNNVLDNLEDIFKFNYADFIFDELCGNFNIELSNGM